MVFPTPLKSCIWLLSPHRNKRLNKTAAESSPVKVTELYVIRVRDLSRHTVAKSAFLKMQSDRVVINVRGGKFETNKSTLENFPNTLLGSEEKRNTYLNSATGEYHFDIAADVFDAILFFYQSNGILSKPEFIDSSIFWDALVHFQIGRRIEKKIVLPSSQWKSNIWVCLEHPDISKIGKLMAFITIVITIGSVVAFCMETLYIDNPAIEVEIDSWFYCEVFVNVYFSLDYILRLLTAVSGWKYFKSGLGIIDLSCILPFYMMLLLMNVRNTSVGLRVLAGVRGLRLLKVLRVFKFIRYSKSLRNQAYAIYKSRYHMVMLIQLFFMGVLVCSSLINLVEDRKDPNFSSLVATSWFVIVTMTTVGYGDIVPKTIIGRITAVFTILTGQVLIFYLLLPIYSKFFHEYFEYRDKDKYEMIPMADLKSSPSNRASQERNLAPLEDIKND